MPGSHLVLLLPLSVALVSAQRSITVLNKCDETVWPAIFSDTSEPLQQPTGWEAKPGDSVTFEVPKGWRGRLWGRTQCSFPRNSILPDTCLTGGCNGGLECDLSTGTGVPPATLAEFTLDSGTGDDWYDVSLVDGFNLEMSITNNVECAAPECKVDLNTGCPREDMKVVDPSGKVVGCKTSCTVSQLETDCCSGAHATPDTCPISGVRYYDHFKQCKDAYAYAYDESSESALWTCNNALQADYTITFCPNGSTAPQQPSESPSMTTPATSQDSTWTKSTMSHTGKPHKGHHHRFSFRPLRPTHV